MWPAYRQKGLAEKDLRTKILDYRESHVGDMKAHSYSGQFGVKSNYKWVLWQIEQNLLKRIISTYNKHGTHLLDFACGTGRIINFLERRFEKATGIDISESMLMKARECSEKAHFLCGDVSQDAFIGAGYYDVITAFRFFLNAQSKLREDVLGWMYKHLKDNGILICNFHLNPKSLTALYHRFYSKINNTQKPNMISIKQAKQLLSVCGFNVLDTYSYGYLFYRQSGVRHPNLMLLIERNLVKISIFNLLARNFILVAKKN